MRINFSFVKAYYKHPENKFTTIINDFVTNDDVGRSRLGVKELPEEIDAALDVHPMK